MAGQRMVLTGHATEAEAREHAERIIAGGFSAGWLSRSDADRLLLLTAALYMAGRLTVTWEGMEEEGAPAQSVFWITVHGGPSLHVVCAWCTADMGSTPCDPAQAGGTSHGICPTCAEELEPGDRPSDAR